jgi:hypothetical protein
LRLQKHFKLTIESDPIVLAVLKEFVAGYFDIHDTKPHDGSASEEDVKSLIQKVIVDWGA